MLILGVAYRGGVKETAFSGVFALRDALEASGATVARRRPALRRRGADALGFAPWDGGPVDGAILQADHGSTAR